MKNLKKFRLQCSNHKINTSLELLKIGIFDLNTNEMRRYTSVSLGDYFENYVSMKVSSGKYSSASEVIRTALRLLESEETKTQTLINELRSGEKSGMVIDFDRNENLKKLHNKHLS